MITFLNREVYVWAWAQLWSRKKPQAIHKEFHHDTWRPNEYNITRTFYAHHHASCVDDKDWVEWFNILPISYLGKKSLQVLGMLYCGRRHIVKMCYLWGNHTFFASGLGKWHSKKKTFSQIVRRWSWKKKWLQINERTTSNQLPITPSIYTYI